MVNGPRPTTLVSPAAAIAAARSQTPTVLSRQHTSIYSTTSATTPVLVYGKDVTPLRGNWADEPWSPKERDAQPVGLVAALDAPISADPALVDDNSSVSGDTAVYNDRQPAVVAVPQPLRDENVAMYRTASNGSEGAASAARTAATSGHVSFVFRYDPYSASNRMEMYRCNCDDCLDRAQVVTGVDFLAAPMYNAPMSYSPMTAARQYDEISPAMSMGHPMNSYDTAPYEPAYVAEQEDPLWSTTSPSAMVAEVPRTSFMPPPPPPRITRRVIAESSEPSLDAESAFYLVIMRWYNKTAAAQVDWVRDDLCPQPDFGEKYTFDEWVDEIGRWWLRNFEHVQVKTSASSGAIRAAATSYSRPAARNGFETHASAAPRLPVPRRMAGNSGLTAEMLESHNQVVAPSGHVRPRRELPW